MIRDARALKPEYVPSDLHHREGQLQQLAAILRPLTPYGSGEHAFISGPSGAGKTAMARFMVGQIESQGLDTRSAYVNCIEDSSKAAVLHRLCRDAGLGSDLPYKSTPAREYIDRLREYDGDVVCIIDEVDVLADRLLLQSLADAEGVVLVMICVDEDDLFSGLDSRVRTRLHSAVKIRLQSYSHAELVDILEGRVKAGLRSGSVRSDAIEDMADRAAGNARKAIALLRRAARAERPRGQITIETVEAVADEAAREVEERKQSRLGTHQRLLYDIIEDCGPIRADGLCQRYESRAGDPKAASTRNRYLDSLERYGLIDRDGCGRGTTYRVA